MDDALEKDPRTLEALERLKGTLGTSAFDIVDHWDGDLVAVGIASPQNHQVLVYISVDDEGYYAELELPPLTQDDGLYRVVGRHQRLDFEELAKVVAAHLALGSTIGD